MKKIFAMIMVICLLASALCITAFAADEPVMTVSGLTKDGPVKIEDYTSFEAGWNFAMEKAKDSKYLDTNQYDRIVIDLFADWEANADGEFGDSDGVGFRQSTIYVPDSARVILNMNGHTIDRGLGDNNELDGEDFYPLFVTLTDGQRAVLPFVDYTFMIALDALKASMTGEEKTLILDASSPIARLFY